jgi:quinol monooxygenase YgiN
MTIGLVVTLTMQPGKGPDFEAAMREYIPLVKAHEPGVLLYSLTKDVNGPPDEYVMMEQYVSKDALDAHGKTAHFQALIAKIGGLLAGPPKTLSLSMLA